MWIRSQVWFPDGVFLCRVRLNVNGNRHHCASQSGSCSWTSSHRRPAWLNEPHSISTLPLRSYPTTPAPTAIVGAAGGIQSIHLWLPHDGNMLTALFVATLEEITCSADTIQQLKALWKAHNPQPDIRKALHLQNQICYSISYCTGHLPFKDKYEQVLLWLSSEEKQWQIRLNVKCFSW